MRTLLAVAFVLFVTLPILLPHGQGTISPGLEAYVGKDLRQLDSKVFLQRFHALTGDKPDPKGTREALDPWWVDRFSSSGAAWMVLEAYPGRNVPDVSAVRVHVFNRSWKRLIKQTFPTGYRFFLREAKVSRDSPLRQDLLVTTTDSAGPFIVIDGGEKKPAFEQGPYQRQYYAFLGDQFAMVRLEDDGGRLVRNNYRWSGPTKGPPVPRRSLQQCIRRLRSTNPAEQLTTLVWLTGDHLSSKEPRYRNVNQESIEDSRRLEAVKDSPETRKALSELTRSKNGWVREFARLALHAAE